MKDIHRPFSVKMKKKKKLVYLACPYSHPDKGVMQERFIAVNRAAAKLMREGVFVFSPISHSHPIHECGDVPGDWEFWKQYDYTILRHCKEMIVLRLPGWIKSVGVRAEMKYMKDRRRPIRFMDPL
jgi:hypothetical protein